MAKRGDYRPRRRANRREPVHGRHAYCRNRGNGAWSGDERSNPVTTRRWPDRQSTTPPRHPKNQAAPTNAKKAGTSTILQKCHQHLQPYAKHLRNEATDKTNKRPGLGTLAHLGHPGPVAGLGTPLGPTRIDDANHTTRQSAAERDQDRANKRPIIRLRHRNGIAHACSTRRTREGVGWEFFPAGRAKHQEPPEDLRLIGGGITLADPTGDAEEVNKPTDTAECTGQQVEHTPADVPQVEAVNPQGAQKRPKDPHQGRINLIPLDHRNHRLQRLTTIRAKIHLLGNRRSTT